MMSQRSVIFAEPVRTTIGTLGGALKEVPARFEKDEHNRPGTTFETLARLKPAFRPNGTITAGNAPGLNDGAAAMVLADSEWAAKRGLVATARLVSYGIAAVEPGMFGLGRSQPSGRRCGAPAGISGRWNGWRSTRLLRPSPLWLPGSLDCRRRLSMWRKVLLLMATRSGQRVLCSPRSSSTR
jgi:hypothetical protein